MTPTSASSVAPFVGFKRVYERYLQWRHEHAPIIIKEEEEQIETFANMNLGDSDFVDGILIASSFIADPTLGIATTVAIILHEIPQRFRIPQLIQGGYSKQKAVLLNFSLCNDVYPRRTNYGLLCTNNGANLAMFVCRWSLNTRSDSHHSSSHPQWSALLCKRFPLLTRVLRSNTSCNSLSTTICQDEEQYS